MQIKSLEYSTYLGLILIAFAIVRTVVAYFDRQYLKQPSERTIEFTLSRAAGSKSENLTLAGLSLAAIALFMTLEDSTFLGPLTNVLGAVFYLSIALVCFITAAYLFQHEVFARYFLFVASSLEMIGVLSIGISMLLLFIENAPNLIPFEIVYGLLLAGVIALGAAETYLEVRGTMISRRHSDDKTKHNENKP